MYGYSKIDNTGGTMNVCNATTCNSASAIVINADNTDIVNGTGGTLNLNKDVTLGYDHSLDSDGAVNIKGVSAVNNLILNDTAVFYSKGATTFSDTYQKVQLNNSAQLNIGSSGTLSATTATGANSVLVLNNSSSIANAGTITFKGTATLAGTSSITNDDSGSPATFTVDDASTYVNYLQVGSIAGDTPTFTNSAGGTVNVDDETASGNGELRVYHGGSYVNSGTTNTWYLNVGRHSTVDGGTFTNTGISGLVNVYSTSTSTATPALDLYRGQITNDSTAAGIGFGNFYIKGYLYMFGTGTGADSATFTNSGITYLLSNMYLYDYSALQLKFRQRKSLDSFDRSNECLW